MSDHDQEEASLALEAAAGSVAAFEVLVRRHQDRVFGLIHRLVGDRERAMDLAQETFLKAWRGLPCFAGQSGFFTWLYRIARNVVISAGRYDAARPRIARSLPARSDDDHAPLPDPPAPEAAPGDDLERKERRRLVLEAIAELSLEFQEVLVLRDMQDRAYEEIADLLDIPLGTVRSRLHRARSELRERLRRVLDPAL